MPWCGPCQRYLAPGALAADDTCPACGEPVELGEVARQAGEGTEEPERAPWHFWAVVAASVVYVGWRIVQLILGGFG